MSHLRFAFVIACLTTNLTYSAEITIKDLQKVEEIIELQVCPITPMFSDGPSIVFQTSSTDLERNRTVSKLWLLTSGRDDKPELIFDTDGVSDSHPRWHNYGTSLLFQSDRSGTSQIWLTNLKNEQPKQLTNLSTGASNAIWSAGGNQIAFYSDVYPEYSELNFDEADRKNAIRIKQTSRSTGLVRVFNTVLDRRRDLINEGKRRHLFVMSQDKDGKWGKPVDVTPGDRDALPIGDQSNSGNGFAFTPEGKHLIFTAPSLKNPGWYSGQDLCRVSILKPSAKWETLIENKTTLSDLSFTDAMFEKDNKTFHAMVWRSQNRIGKWDIESVQCKLDGTLIDKPRNCTRGITGSVMSYGYTSSFPRVDSNTGSIHFIADEISESAVYWTSVIDNREDKNEKEIVPEKYKEIKEEGRITRFVALHSTFGLGSMRYVLSKSSMKSPAEIVTYQQQKIDEYDRKRVVALNNDLLFWTTLNMPETVKVKIEGGEMPMWVFKPVGFDDKKKWPVVYLLGECDWQNGWNSRWNPHLWAAQGYAVVVPHVKMSSSLNDWGGKCYRDLVAGLDYVERLPYVDKERIGSAGGSFGGYMQNWFAVNDIAKRFKCLISHCSVWNFESMWGTTDELWFDEWEHGGLPWEKPGKYAEFSPHKKAGKLAENKCPMLVIHNDYDYRCPIGQGHELFSALQRLKVPSKFVNFPDEGHWVLKPKNSQHWHKEVFAWLTKYCPPGGK